MITPAIHRRHICMYIWFFFSSPLADELWPLDAVHQRTFSYSYFTNNKRRLHYGIVLPATSRIYTCLISKPIGKKLRLDRVAYYHLWVGQSDDRISLHESLPISCIAFTPMKGIYLADGSYLYINHPLRRRGTVREIFYLHDSASRLSCSTSALQCRTVFTSLITCGSATQYYLSTIVYIERNYCRDGFTSDITLHHWITNFAAG